MEGGRGSFTDRVGLSGLQQFGRHEDLHPISAEHYRAITALESSMLVDACPLSWISIRKQYAA